MSLPTRERGLKSTSSCSTITQGEVAPHAGAWIEIDYNRHNTNKQTVAPHAGAWIEIYNEDDIRLVESVAPHAGAWIEMITGWQTGL